MAGDACPFRTGVVRVGGEAGPWRYSGGGYSVLQLLIEEVSGEPFADFMQRTVLAPLGMTRSTYRTGAQGSGNVAEFFDSDGQTAPHNHYTAAAAASLYSTANEMTRFVEAHLAGLAGEAPWRGVISSQSLKRMLEPQATVLGVAHWGMGLQLYATSTRGGFIYGHSGGNTPAVGASVRIESSTGDAIVALSTGGRNIAANLGSEWTAQRQAAMTPVMLYGAVQRLINPLDEDLALGLIAGGWVFILIGCTLVWHRVG